MLCDKVDSIIKDLTSINTMNVTKNVRLESKLSPKNDKGNLKSYFESVR